MAVQPGDGARIPQVCWTFARQCAFAEVRCNLQRAYRHTCVRHAPKHFFATSDHNGTLRHARAIACLVALH